MPLVLSVGGMYGESRSQPGNAGRLIPLNPEDYKRIVFFTGAGMSAECGVPTYRGKGGIWDKYNWEEVACQSAFERNPEDVLQFHELRRRNVQKCNSHAGHAIISNLQKSHSNVVVITQNIDGMHQLSGSKYVIELHGSLWRLRCLQEGKIIEDISYSSLRLADSLGKNFLNVEKTVNYFIKKYMKYNEIDQNLLILKPYLGDY